MGMGQGQWIGGQIVDTLGSVLSPLTEKIKTGNSGELDFILEPVEKFKKRRFPLPLNPQVGFKVIQGGLRKNTITRTPQNNDGTGPIATNRYDLFYGVQIKHGIYPVLVIDISD
jgi:hypothetical protein